MNLQGKSVLVLGLGISGMAMVRWCAAQGAALRVADSRTDPPNARVLREEWPAAELHLGAADLRLLDSVDLLAVSPGIAPHDSAFGPLLDAARQRGVTVLSELGLFMAALRELHQRVGYAPKVLAITGTNGKTTVTALTAELLRGAGLDAVAAGNIGPAMLDVLQTRLNEDRLPVVWVLELSSFQLHGALDFAASAATVLNVTQDHLDWHGTMDAYAADKARIFGPFPWSLSEQPGLMLLNRDDALVMAMRREGRRSQTFGLDAPHLAGDWGVVQEHGMAWLARAQGQVDEDAPKRRGKNAPPLPQAAVVLQMLMPADALRIRGRHNWANALAALALAESAGAPLASMLHSLRAYRGEPHRMQVLGVVGGVEWIEDSKGTNVGATVAALRGMDRPVVLIAGGDGKGQDFAPLAHAAAGKLRAAVLIGRDAGLLAQTLERVCPVEQAGSLEQAVERAAVLAREGDVVLLSPACASLDMFRNYVHRAEVFVAAVRAWAETQGAMLEGQS